MPHTPLRLAFRRPWPGTLRGLILWLFGWAIGIIGAINYIGTTIPEPTRTYLSFPLDHAPAVAYGVAFVVTGLVAAVSGYCHFGRDKWGYLLASLVTAIWGLCYVCGFLFYGAPLRACGGAVVWLLFAGILSACARIPKMTLDDLGDDCR